MNELQVFNYNDTPLRTIERDGELWWVLKDVCDALCIVDSKSVPRRLESDEVVLIPLVDSKGRKQEMYAVNEPGLYNVILRSDKPEAKDFKRWVTHEVLPSIRRTGSYSTALAAPMSPAQLIAAQAQLLVDMEQKVNAVQTQTLKLEAKVDTAIKAFSRPSVDHWKDDMDKAIKELCTELSTSLPKTRGKMYEELERVANCNIDARLGRLRGRMRHNGMRYRDAMALTKLDAIAADKKLRAIFEGIVRSWQAKAVEVEVDHEDV